MPWEAEGTFDGISTYKLDSNGKIYEHSVTNVVLRDPPLALAANPLSLINLKPAQTPQLGSWIVSKEEEMDHVLGAFSPAPTPTLPNPKPHSSATFSAMRYWLRLYNSLVNSLLLVQGISRIIRNRRVGV